MNKALRLPIIGIVLLTIGGALYVFISQVGSNKYLSEAEIRQKFRCDRITADVLATDIYCENPEYYYEDVKRGAVIDESDFDALRQR